MAARVLLLGILFTEVVEPVCAAGVRGTGNNLNGKNGSKGEGVDVSLARSFGQTLRIEPEGYVPLGKKGVTLNCLSGNNHDVSWLYNDQVASSYCGIGRCTLLENGSLYVKKEKNSQLVQKSKWNGTRTHEFRCIGRTSSGGFLRSAPTFLHIAELSHSFKQSPIDSAVHEGAIARLSCFIDSFPYPPNITWHHNGEPILSAHNNTKYFMVPPGVLYIIATKPSDAGSYRCIATNDFIKKTKKSKEAKLTIVPKVKGKMLMIKPSLFPQITYNHLLISGSNLSLVCAASGTPSSFITWSFRPQYPEEHDHAQPQLLLNSSTGISILVLSNVSVSDAGIYLCSTQNVLNSGMEIQNITVDVAVPPSFIKRPKNQMCPNGKTVRFDCQVQGIPTPKIYWLKDAENITIEGRRTTYIKENNKMVLAISATVPSDSGDYQCVAVNSAGEIWASGRLHVNSSRNSPAVPTALRCYAQSLAKIFISWMPPESLPMSSITAYTVYYSPTEGGKEEVSLIPGNSTSLEVTKNLEPYTNYSFYVRVWNNHGASDQSATIVCATAPSVPKTAPKVHVDILSSSKVNVTWQPLTKKEARGIIVEYQIQWRLHDYPSFRVDSVPASSEHYILTDLLPGAQYDLRVLARTENGWPSVNESLLEWTKIVMPTANSIDKKMRNIIDIQLINVNASHLKMTWNIKEVQNDQDIEFDSWQIYCERLNGDKLLTHTLNRNSTEYLFTNLEPNVSYNVGLCILNQDIPSDCLSKTVKSVRHSSDAMPISLAAIPLSSSSIQITWTVLNNTGSEKFEICYQAVQQLGADPMKCILINVTKAVVKELKPFTLYQFRVRQFRENSRDCNDFSESIECYTIEDIPCKPEDVRSFQSGTHTRITWNEPINPNGVILTYFISYYSDLSEPTMSWGNVTVPGNQTSVVLSDLRLGSRYYILVQAATKAGYGKPSTPLVVFVGSNDSKIPTSSDKQKPPASPKPDQSLGVILGVGISFGFIIISLCSIYCRQKWEHSRSMRETSPTLKNRTLIRNGNACCVDRSSTPMSQQANNQTSVNEIELTALCPSSPMSLNQELDTKGALCNGLVEACAKDPLLPLWDSSPEGKGVHITTNSQYEEQGSPISSKQSEGEGVEEDEEEIDLDATELTMLECTRLGSTSSLNNNFGCSMSSSTKIVPPVIPVLEPNG